jgi:hypothetical protein
MVADHVNNLTRLRAGGINLGTKKLAIWAASPYFKEPVAIGVAAEG